MNLGCCMLIDPRCVLLAEANALTTEATAGGYTPSRYPNRCDRDMRGRGTLGNGRKASRTRSRMEHLGRAVLAEYCHPTRRSCAHPSLPQERCNFRHRISRMLLCAGYKRLFRRLRVSTSRNPWKMPSRSATRPAALLGVDGAKSAGKSTSMFQQPSNELSRAPLLERISKKGAWREGSACLRAIV